MYRTFNSASELENDLDNGTCCGDALSYTSPDGEQGHFAQTSQRTAHRELGSLPRLSTRGRPLLI